MWLFKKRTEPKEAPTITATTVVCIPGLWKDIDDIKNAIHTSSNAEFMVVDDMLLSIKNERHYKFQICGKDEQMKTSFKYAGNTTGIKDEALDEIEKHNFVIYISGETGSFKEAENIALAGAAVLKGGGMGIKIDTTGKAFEKSKWLNLIKKFEEIDLYQMFVVDSIIDEEDSVWSCGMHNLGLRDTIISGEKFQTAVDLITIFGYYQILDKPTISAGEIFQPDLNYPQYFITNEPDQPYKGVELYENPFGMWRLTRKQDHQQEKI